MKMQFLSLLAARGCGSVLQAATVVLFARWGGAENFGLVSTITGVGAVLFIFADWGLSTYIPTARARGLNSEVRLGIRLQMFGSSCAASIGILATFLWLHENSGTLWFCLLLPATALEQITEARLAIAIADGNKSIVASSILLRRFVSLSAFVAFYGLGINGLQSYAMSMLLGSGLGFVHVVASLARHLSSDCKKIALRPFYQGLTPFLVANVSSQARSLDVGIVATVSSVASAAFYSAAFRFTNPLMLVSGSAVAILLPHSSKKSAGGAKKLSRKVIFFTLLSSLPLLIPIVFSVPIVTAIFGDEFRPSAGAFAWALALVPFMSLDWTLNSILQGQGAQRFVAINALIFAPITLLAVAGGALWLGPTGAAGGMALSYVVKVVSPLIRIHKLKTTPAKSESAEHSLSALRD